MTLRIDTLGDDHTVASWIWHNLVPKNGQASTVQGELLRSVEKLRWEAQENGNINWDEGFISLVDFLEQTLTDLTHLTDSERQTIRTDLRLLRAFVPESEVGDESDNSSLPYIEDDLYDRLSNFVVAFARSHPEPLKHKQNPNLGR